MVLNSQLFFLECWISFWSRPGDLDYKFFLFRLNHRKIFILYKVMYKKLVKKRILKGKKKAS